MSTLRQSEADLLQGAIDPELAPTTSRERADSSDELPAVAEGAIPRDSPEPSALIETMASEPVSPLPDAERSAGPASAPPGVNWALTLAHAKAGHTNAQEVIRFVDTKTGVMTGLASLTTAAPITFFQWAVGLDEKRDANFTTFFASHPGAAYAFYSLLLLGMGLGALSVINSVHGLMARNPRKKGSYQGLKGFILSFWNRFRGRGAGGVATSESARITYLFPLYLEQQETTAWEFCKLSSGLSEKEISEEYAIQLFQNGRILDRKIRQNQKAVAWFKLQVYVYAVAVASGCILLYLGI